MKRVAEHRVLTSDHAPSRARQRVALGDVLVSMTRPNLNAVAIVTPDLEGAVASTGFHVLRAQGVEPRWLYYAVQTQAFIDKMCELVQGALYPAVRPRDVVSFDLPLPPQAEQRRIVAKIEEHLSALDAAVVGLERARANLRRFRDSTIGNAVLGLSMTGDLNSTEDATKWQWKPLSVLGNLKGGITKGQRIRAGEVVREIPYLRVANVQRGYLDLSEVKCITARESEISALTLHVGDVLFNEGGDRDKLGRGWVWNAELAECIHQNHVFRFRPNVNIIDPKYLSYYSNSHGQKYFLEQGKQTTNLASINLTKLGGLPVPVPPLRQQREIVALIESHVSVCDKLNSDVEMQLVRAKRLRQSVLKSAFEGSLSVSDGHSEVRVTSELDRREEPPIRASSTAKRRRSSSTRAG